VLLHDACAAIGSQHKSLIIKRKRDDHRWEAEKGSRPNFEDDAATSVEGGARHGCLANGCGATRPYDTYIDDV